MSDFQILFDFVLVWFMPAAILLAYYGVISLFKFLVKYLRTRV